MAGGAIANNRLLALTRAARSHACACVNVTGLSQITSSPASSAAAA